MPSATARNTTRTSPASPAMQIACTATHRVQRLTLTRRSRRPEAAADGSSPEAAISLRPEHRCGPRPRRSPPRECSDEVRDHDRGRHYKHYDADRRDHIGDDTEVVREQVVGVATHAEP